MFTKKLDLGVFVDAFRYPFYSLVNFRRFIIASILFCGSFLIIPGVLFMGYQFRIIEHTLRGENELPGFGNFCKLFMNGLRLIGVYIIYSIPLLVLIVLPFVWGEVNDVICFVMSFFVTWFYVLGIGNMVYENKFTAAFKPKKIIHHIKEINPTKYTIYILIYNLITFTITYMPIQMVSTVTDISPILYVLLSLLIISIYFSFVESRFIGLIYPYKKKSM